MTREQFDATAWRKGMKVMVSGYEAECDVISVDFGSRQLKILYLTEWYSWVNYDEVELIQETPPEITDLSLAYIERREFIELSIAQAAGCSSWKEYCEMCETNNTVMEQMFHGEDVINAIWYIQQRHNNQTQEG